MPLSTLPEISWVDSFFVPSLCSGTSFVLFLIKILNEVPDKSLTAGADEHARPAPLGPLFRRTSLCLGSKVLPFKSLDENKYQFMDSFFASCLSDLNEAYEMFGYLLR